MHSIQSIEDIEFLNSYRFINSDKELIGFISSLNSYTCRYISILTDFDRKNWLVKRINDYMIYTGKMIRSSFFYCFVLGMLRGRGYELKVEEWDKIFRLGAIFELAHTATLVHDDILDNAKKRRGKPAVHVKFGVDGAIIFGDVLIISVLNRAYDIDPVFSRFLMQALENMCFGEILQYQNRFNIFLDESDYLKILSLKTGVLFGAIAKSAYYLVCQILGISYDYNLANHLDSLFDRYGISFQIVDDVLDYVQDQSILKKDSNNDILSGRVTYPLILILKNSSNKRKLQRTWISNPSYFLKRINQTISKNSQIIDLSLKKAKELMDLKELEMVLSKLTFDEISKNVIKVILNYLVDRKF
ncbi:MAG: polyprenyl synthetase family protein [bacterium]